MPLNSKVNENAQIFLLYAMKLGWKSVIFYKTFRVYLIDFSLIQISYTDGFKTKERSNICRFIFNNL